MLGLLLRIWLRRRICVRLGLGMGQGLVWVLVVGS